MFELIESLSLRTKYVKDVNRLERELVPAANRGKTECCRSGHCCWRAPAELTPDDLTRLAAHKGLSPSEFFRQFCVVDTHVRDAALIVRLRRSHQTGGEMTGWRETFSVESPCVFLTPDGCEVHAVKPECCAAYKCWSPDPSDVVADRMRRWSRDEIAALGWDGVNPDGG